MSDGSENGAAAPAPWLAVVIPAYRRRYLGETLASLAAQTERGFRVYVADDGSPENLEEVAAGFAGRLDLVYRRFPDNCGIAGLVRHWERALALTSEPWLWLFSDDDRAAPDSVAALRADLARAPESRALRRLDLEFVDAAGRRLRREQPFPAELGGEDFAYRLLRRFHERCIVQNIVFPREVWVAEGGFSETVGGYCADYATWPRFARAGGVRRVRGGGVQFRDHAESVGMFVAFRSERRADAIRAYATVLRSMRKAVPAAVADTPRWRAAEMAWFGAWFRYLPRLLTREERGVVAGLAGELWPEQPWRWRARFWRNYAIMVLRDAARRLRAA